MDALERERLTRQYTRYIARRTDGSGVCALHCQTATADYFGFDKFPVPKDHGILDPTGKYRMFGCPGNKRGANNMSLRIAYSRTPGRQKPNMTRFRISGDPVLDTVQVITNFLNESGVDWLYIANKNGNPLSRSAFHSDAV